MFFSISTLVQFVSQIILKIKTTSSALLKISAAGFCYYFDFFFQFIASLADFQTSI